MLLNEIPHNVHILLVNNGIGTEFKNYNHRAAYFGEDANNYMAAKGHNGFKNIDLVRNICKNLNVQYLSASSKGEFLAVRDGWLRENTGPVLLEVFTNDRDESKALEQINTVVLPDFKDQIEQKIKKTAVNLAYKILKRGQ